MAFAPHAGFSQRPATKVSLWHVRLFSGTFLVPRKGLQPGSIHPACFEQAFSLTFCF